MKKIVLAGLAILLMDCCAPSKEEHGKKTAEVADAVTSEKREVTSPESIKEEVSEAELDSELSAGNRNIQSGQITAAEWNDLNHWNFWDSLQRESEFSATIGHWNYNLSQRISVHVTNKQRQVIKNKKIDLLNSSGEVMWAATTDQNGRAELWPLQKQGRQSNTKGLKIQVGNFRFDAPKFFEEGINEISIDEAVPETRPKIDIAYMVDATGSMGDELEYLKAELADVIARVKKNHPAAEINSGSVFYRDNGDEYLTRKADFSPGIDNTLQFIKAQSAGGGGDFPEAVENALEETVHKLQWSHNSLKLAFMILDAPPHHSSEVISQIHRLTAQAASKGIRLIPVVASGIDKDTEFLMRHMAIATNGTYVFITDDSGIGESHLQASVGAFQVEHLNDLMVRLISESL